jgi:hypothetical protein
VPTAYTLGNATAIITAIGFNFSIQGSTCPTLEKAIERYRDLSFPHALPAANAFVASGIAGLQITVSDVDESHPQLGTGEWA